MQLSQYCQKYLRTFALLLQIARILYSIVAAVLLLVFPFVQNIFQGIDEFSDYGVTIGCLQIISGVLSFFKTFTICAVTKCCCDDCAHNCEYVLNIVVNLLSIGASASAGGLLVCTANNSNNSTIIYGFAAVELFYVLFYIVEDIVLASACKSDCCAAKSWSGVAFAFLFFRLLYCFGMPIMMFTRNKYECYEQYQLAIPILLIIQVIFMIFCLISISCNENYNDGCTENEKIEFTGPASMLSLFMALFASIAAGGLEKFIGSTYSQIGEKDIYIQYFAFASVELLYCIIYFICIVVSVSRSCLTYCGDTCYTRVLQLLMIIRLFLSFIIGLYNLVDDDHPKETNNDKDYLKACGYIQLAQTALNLFCIISYSIDIRQSYIDYSMIPIVLSFLLCGLFGASGGLQYTIGQNENCTDMQRIRYYICFAVDLFYMIVYFLFFIMYVSQCRKSNRECLKSIVEEKKQKKFRKEQQNQKQEALIIETKENERKQKEAEEKIKRQQIEQESEQLRLKKQQEDDELKRKIQEREEQRQREEEQQRLQKLEEERRQKQLIEEQRIRNLEAQEYTIIQSILNNLNDLVILQKLKELVTLQEQFNRLQFQIPQMIVLQLVERAQVAKDKIYNNEIAKCMMDQKQWESIANIPMENVLNNNIDVQNMVLCSSRPENGDQLKMQGGNNNISMSVGIVEFSSLVDKVEKQEHLAEELEYMI